MLPLLCAMDVIGLWAYRGRWSAENLRIILPGGLLGVVLGTLTFRYFSESVLRGLLGVIAVSFVLHWFFTGRGAASATSPSRIKGWFWSGVSGVTSTIAHAGGPPLNVYLLPLRLERREFVATTVLFFAIINATKVLPYGRTQK